MIKVYRDEKGVFLYESRRNQYNIKGAVIVKMVELLLLRKNRRCTQEKLHFGHVKEKLLRQ
jgi:hypothetical protein